MRAFAYRARQSFWFLPTVFGVVAIALAQGLVSIDHALIDGGASQILFLDGLTASGGRSILSIIGTSMLTVAGTSFSITISVLATTSSTYGPRLVRNFLADRANQLVLAVFTSTFLYALVVLRSVRTAGESGGGFVPTISIHVAVLGGVADVAVLVFFIHHIADSVQITTLQKRVQNDLVRAVDLVYPEALAAQTVNDRQLPLGDAAAVSAVTDGYVQQVDLEQLRRSAVAESCVIEVEAMPGAHVIAGEPLVRVAPQSSAGVVEKRIRAAFDLGSARTPTQDVGFALQQLVEVAVRGLASGSNDPYTAVTALDLAATALVPLVQRPGAATGLLDEAGDLRVILTWPDPEALVLSVFDAVDTYGLEHPLVIDAALRLAKRLSAAAEEPRIVTTLDAATERLQGQPR